MQDIYSHGHHPSVLRSHSWRTAENSAAYLLPELRSGMRLLDVGSGPGTVTVDLAELVAPGEVLGIDIAESVVDVAREHALERNAPEALRFEVGDAYDLRAQGLGIEDGSFDVVHAHQVLQHLTDPVAALVEWKRVLAPGGIVAARDSDYAAGVMAPDDPLLDRWRDLYHDVTRANHSQADAGRYLLGWAHKAGFSDVRFTSSTWTFSDADSRAWWGDLWAERVLASSFAEQALAYGLSDPEELAAISGAWRRWAAHPDGTIIIVLGEIIARVER